MRRSILLLFVICGCSTHQVYRTTPVPPLPWNQVSGQKHLSGVEVVPETRHYWATLQWTNAPDDYASNYVTGVEASVDLINWEEVVSLPYTAGCVTVTVTNRPSREYYRAFNR